VNSTTSSRSLALPTPACHASRLDGRPTVLFLCTGNSCRSQIAEGWLQHLAGDRMRVLSAGTNPVGIHPNAARVMKEAGVDISAQTSDFAGAYTRTKLDLVVTLCGHAAENCPPLAEATKVVHWPFSDPVRATGTEEEILDAFRATRDAIRARLESWLEAGAPDLESAS